MTERIEGVPFDPPPKEEPGAQIGPIRLSRSTLFTLVVCFALIVTGRVFPIVRVVGDSMYPTYQSGNLLMTTRDISELSQDDIIVFTLDEERKDQSMKINEDGRTHLMVKRIVGVPGDSLIAREGFLYVNGHPAPLEHDLTMNYAGNLAGGMTLASGEYYVLGDNRNHSYDSRYFGPITFDDMLGRVKYRLFGSLINH